MGKKSPLSLPELDSYLLKNLQELGIGWEDRWNAFVEGKAGPGGETYESWMQKVMALPDEVIFTIRRA